MNCRSPIGSTFLTVSATCVSIVALMAVAAGAGDGVEALEITVGTPTKLSDLTYDNKSSLSVSRTGVIAAFYSAKLGQAPKHYRTSTDGGVTWGPPMDAPAQLAGGTAGVTLRDGGVLKFLTSGDAPMGEAEAHKSPMVGEYKAGWFMLHSTFAWFNDDFTQYEIAPVHVYMPDAVTTKQTQLPMSTWPMFADDTMIQLDNGDLLAAMQGVFNGDTRARTIISRSSDRGRTWRYHATVAILEQDPNPNLPGWYLGHAEPSIEMLSNGRMICVMRTQYAHWPNEYRPMHVSWSEDLGRTWTSPQETVPHLMNICPEVVALNNGVVACEYGRPGFHVVFSLDNGHTWQDRISFSHLPEPYITGQFHMIKVGPNKLVAIGNDAGGRPELSHRGYPDANPDHAGGVKVWPITVERVRVSPAHVSVRGRVLDQQGNPIADAAVERSPNRYSADDWRESTDLDLWKAGPRVIGMPKLGFRSIQTVNDHPTVRTDGQGRFRFDAVELGGQVITVEAAGHAPQQRHVKVQPRPEPVDFTLEPGRLLRGRVVDAAGEPIAGVCVVLNQWHTHTDLRGYYHWSVESPVPDQVALQVYKRYSGRYETLETRVALSQIASHPIILKKN